MKKPKWWIYFWWASALVFGAASLIAGMPINGAPYIAAAFVIGALGLGPKARDPDHCPHCGGEQ